MTDMEQIAEPIASILGRISLEPQGGRCDRCEDRFPYLAADDPMPQFCRRCEKTKAEEVAILFDLDRHVSHLLRQAGLEDVELVASLQSVPANIALRLPVDAVGALLRGETPSEAFGLSGAPGVGKTMALAAIVREATHQRLQRRVSEVGAAALEPWLRWLPWPETVNKIRVLSMADGGVRRVDDLVRDAVVTEVLVLDDVGAERIRGEFASDASASRLELIVDTRYRQQSPTFFTTNLDSFELDRLYGARLCRRLEALAPLIVLPRKGA